MKLGRRLTVALTVTVAGVTMMATTQAGAATLALPKNGNLVFVQFGGLVMVPGGSPAPYTGEIAGERPKYSPDGRQVAFVRDDYSIWTRTLSTGSERLVHQYPADGEHYAIALAWSPDGHALVTAYGAKLDRIAVADGALSTIWTAPAATGRLTSPAWSPDGSRIAFSTGNMIKLVHPDGTNLITLTSGPVGVINNYPDWSPDSQKIAFITNRYRGAEHSELVTLPRSGAGEPFRVSYQAYPQGIFYIGVAWSPDGQKIAALQFNRNALPDPEDTDERFKVRGYLPDGSHSYSLTGPIAGDDVPEGLDWAPKVS